MIFLEWERERERGKEEEREARENEYCWWVPNLAHAVMHNIIIFYLEHRNKPIACLKQVVLPENTKTTEIQWFLEAFQLSHLQSTTLCGLNSS